MSKTLKLKNFLEEDLNQLLERDDYVSFISRLPGIFQEKPNPENSFRKLKAWELINTISIDALTNFRERNLELFDASVGDSRCETRAFYFLNLIYENEKKFSEILDNSIEKFKTLNHKTKLLLLSQSSTFDLNIHRSILYIIYCYILSISKEQDSNNTLKTKKEKLINAYPLITGGLAKNLLSKSKQFVSMETIRFLQRESKKVTDVFKPYAKYLQDKYVVKNSSNIHFAPGFFGIQVILDRMTNRYKNIWGIKVNFFKRSKLIKQENLIFRIDNGRTILPIDPEESNLEKDAVYTLEGCCYLQDSETIQQKIDQIHSIISENGIRHLISPIFLHKPVYTTNTNKTFDVEEESIQSEMNHFRSLPGFSINDPTLLCLTHISLLSFKELLVSPDVKKPNYLPGINQEN